MNALEIKNLTRSFDGFKLDNVSLTLPSGCIMGLIGENGAGKSTVMRLILNNIRKDSGSITVLGRDNGGDMRDVKEEIGVVMDEIGIPPCLTTAQVGRVMEGTFHSWDGTKYASLLHRFSVPEGKPFKEFSRGTKMKLAIAIALSHGSRLLLLDEATSGLDPVSRDDVLDILLDFTRDETHSVLISSHIVSDLEKLCDYVAFLSNGKLLLCEEKDLLLSRYGIFRGAPSDVDRLEPAAVKYKKETPYGVEALVVRSAVPAGTELSPIGVEDLFIYMIKGAK